MMKKTNLKLIISMLKHHGYVFETAADGTEALVKAKSFKPDLIFLDIMMPEMDGYEACKRLKEDAATKHIPVVMVTALADKESRIKGLEMGANDFLSKPVDSTELMVRTKNLLRVKEFEDFLKGTMNSLKQRSGKRRHSSGKAT